MLINFNEDKKIGKIGENIALKTLSANYPEYKFIDVSENRKDRYKGDILATDIATGKQFYFEVKNDSRIAETGNIFCEEESYIVNEDRYISGAMQNDNDYYCVVSEAQRQIYIFDFRILKQIYKSGSFRQVNRSDQITYAYVLPIGTAKRHEALKKILYY